MTTTTIRTPVDILGIVLPTGPEGAYITVKRILDNGQPESWNVEWPVRERGEEHAAWIDRCEAWANKRWSHVTDD